MSKTRGNNKQSGRRKCDPRNSRQFRKSLSLWQFMHPAKKISPDEKGALIYLGEPMERSE